MYAMTFHEAYGALPVRLLKFYRRYNVSPADHDIILSAFGYEWNSDNIEWERVIRLAEVSVGPDNVFRLSAYMG